MNTRTCKLCDKEKLLECFYPSQLKQALVVCKECLNKTSRLSGDRGYVYVIINPAWSDWCKVGITTGSVEIRLLPYQTCSPFRDYEIYYTKLFNNIYDKERDIHQALEDKGYIRRYEWFNITPEEVIKYI